jgi:hypothetical protein
MPSEKDVIDNLVLASRNNSRLRLQETVVLGLLASKKWDRPLSGKPANHQVTPQELSQADNFTDDDIQGFRAAAQTILHEYAITLPQPQAAERPQRTWSESGWGVAEGLVAALLYSMFLAIIFFILKMNDADFITILRQIVGPEKKV